MYTLTHADDILLIGKDEEGMPGSTKGLKKYLGGKKVDFICVKTKIMGFRK